MRNLARRIARSRGLFSGALRRVFSVFSRSSAKTKKIDSSGHWMTPLTDLLESLEAAAPPRRAAWRSRLWFWWAPGAKRVAAATSQKRPRRRPTPRRERPSKFLSAAESLEPRLALSANSDELLGSGPTQVATEAHAVAFVETAVSSPYVVSISGDDVDLGLHRDSMVGRDVIVVSADPSAGGEDLGSLLVDSLSGLTSLQVMAPVDVVISQSVSVSGQLSFAGGVTFVGHDVTLAADSLEFGGAIVVSPAIQEAGGLGLTITTASADRPIQLGGDEADAWLAGSSLWLGNSTLAVLNAAGLASITIGGAEHVGGVSLAAGAFVEASQVVTLESQSVDIAGTIRAGESTRGGEITITGDVVDLADTARLDASGSESGGLIQVGGSWQNSDPTVRQAVVVNVDQGAVLDASATEQGDGGEIVVWSDITNPESATMVAGTLLARGGSEGGDGGRIETSGHVVDLEHATIDTTADAGKPGKWLIDPTDVTIDATTAASIASSLNAGQDVEIQADNTITVASAISAGGTGTLTLNAGNGIVLNSAITRSAAGALVLNAGAGGTSGSGNISVASGSSVTFGQAGDSTYAGVISGNGGIVKQGAGNLTLSQNQTYQGSTSVSGGTLTLTGTDLDTSSIDVSANAIIDFNPTADTDQGYWRTGITWTGAGTIRKSGSKQFSLTGVAADTFSMSDGALLDIQGGRVVYFWGLNTSYVNNHMDVNIESGATWDLWDSPETRVGKLTGSGTIAGGSYQNANLALITVGDLNKSSVFSGTYNNWDNVFRKVGSGTFEFAGTNQNGYDFEVNEGTFVFSGTNAQNWGENMAVSIAEGAVYQANSSHVLGSLTSTSATSGVVIADNVELRVGKVGSNTTFG